MSSELGTKEERPSGDPLVTVLIDTYNYGDLIHRAVESALDQTYPASRIEILVVDDGSTDHTAGVMRRYEDRVRYVYKSNGGQASAINQGLRLAQGEIICLLDGDDIFYPEKVRLVVDAFVRHPKAGIVYSRFDVVDVAGNKQTLPYKLLERAGILEARTLLGYGSYGWVTSSISLRKGAVQGIEIPEDPFRLYVDYFLLSIVPLISEVAIVDTPVCAWVLHGNNHVLRNSDRFAPAGNIAIRQYAQERLGKQFVTYLGQSDYAVDLRNTLARQEKLRLFFADLAEIALSDVDLIIKVRAELKLLAALLLPPSRYGQARAVRAKLQQAFRARTH